jgi:hypothetical protein
VRGGPSASRSPPPRTRIPTSPTWAPFEGDADRNHDHRLDPAERRDLPDTANALPAQRKLPITDAAHVRAALARFDQVAGNGDLELAFANIRAAARHYGVPVAETRWEDIGRSPQTPPFDVTPA